MMTHVTTILSLYQFTLLIVTLFDVYYFFFFNPTPTSEIYTLSLHDALPIFRTSPRPLQENESHGPSPLSPRERVRVRANGRSEEHTSELQSLTNLVCRLLLEKKKKKKVVQLNL